ncbi:Dolichyl-diphosphooligosaccharide--protein glycosyltransferase [Giardia muris]|uniref:dolichyl-diphosphooligosaccharide--protein glycotransferase n=1 Tax=Giardia muris TaxID=5742 RepID=A0A4Z1SLV4_GIAMU|nr:Dolichyl-diphosphooligosaccharide--protein glycosyltransferase [Giardia muris]|eukprot:TNJ26652.1 Dolichyl-diphosphooligosaccharide--protein glycosyltransferase [Giardia muris]
MMPGVVERYVLRPLAVIDLVLIGALAFFCRLMSIVRYELVIHEFDPYFQYKATLYLHEHGSAAFQEWLDTKTWYPLSRSMPISLYPGLMYTSEFFVRVCAWLRLPLSILQACAFMGPVMSVVGCFAAYDMGSLIDGSPRTRTLTGILTALFFSIIPGFIQRSVAGSYDNESNSITAMIIGFNLWLRASSTEGSGSKRWCSLTPLLAVLAYLYMVMSWGAYVFLAILIPLHVFLAILCGMATPQLLAAFRVWEPLSLLAVGLVWREHAGVFTTPVYLPGIGTYLLVIAAEFRTALMPRMRPQSYTALKRFVVLLALVFGLGVGIPVGLKLGLIGKLSGRLLSFINPTYAKRFNPIVASVAEHQPTVWASFYFNAGFLIVTVPVALYYAIIEARSLTTLFLAAYVATTTWFSAVMARMILISSPALSVCAGYAIAKAYEAVVIEQRVKSGKGRVRKLVSIVVILAATCTFIQRFMSHALYCAQEVYSSPSVVLISSQRGPDGRQVYIDDFREAFSWFEHNTAPEARLASWWDYGYQINQLSDRTTLVDGLTRSTYWIGWIGAMLASDEDTAHRICRELGIDYVLVWYGGQVGYSGDDLNKLLWPVRIAGNRHFEERFDWLPGPIVERDYYGGGSNYHAGEGSGGMLRRSLLYKLSYASPNEAQAQYGGGNLGFDRVRMTTFTPPRLRNFKEAYSTEHLLVRVYQVAGSGRNF